MKKAQDLTGQQFGSWTVLANLGRDKKSVFVYECLCICGNKSKVNHYTLINGRSTRCASCNNISRRTHNMTKTPTWSAWNCMVSRCCNPNTKLYVYYGARGIKVCERWLDFNNFLEDMGECPNGKELGRIDVNGDYNPDNAIWTTHSHNMRNQRKRSTASNKYKGVSKHKQSGKWQAKIVVDYKQIYLGLYSTEEAAKTAYDNYIETHNLLEENK